MHFDQCLDEGWSIAPDVIKGACRHLVRDRFELKCLSQKPLF
jgi:hypothetical protein